MEGVAWLVVRLVDQQLWRLYDILLHLVTHLTSRFKCIYKPCARSLKAPKYRSTNPAAAHHS